MSGAGKKMAPRTCRNHVTGSRNRMCGRRFLVGNSGRGSEQGVWGKFRSAGITIYGWSL